MSLKGLLKVPPWQIQTYTILLTMVGSSFSSFINTQKCSSGLFKSQKKNWKHLACLKSKPTPSTRESGGILQNTLSYIIPYTNSVLQIK
jgi:hypothetical protein